MARDAPTLWLVNLNDPTTRERAEAVAPLPGEAAQFAARGDAAMRLLHRRLARLLLAAAGSCRPDAVTIGATPLGAPVVAHPAAWHLSLAARWPDCLIGVAPAPLGVDVERVDRALPPAVDLLTPGERQRLTLADAVDRPRLFARAWAAKESHAKWLGDPLRVDPARVDTHDAHVASPWGTTRCWRYERGDLVAAVCVAG